MVSLLLICCFENPGFNPVPSYQLRCILFYIVLTASTCFCLSVVETQPSPPGGSSLMRWCGITVIQPRVQPAVRLAAPPVSRLNSISLIASPALCSAPKYCVLFLVWVASKRFPLLPLPSLSPLKLISKMRKSGPGRFKGPEIFLLVFCWSRPASFWRVKR